MEREKPELLTRGDVFMDYYFVELIEEQRKTNALLEQLLGVKPIEQEQPIQKTFFQRLFGK